MYQPKAVLLFLDAIGMSINLVRMSNEDQKSKWWNECRYGNSDRWNRKC
jgi:hypothetical protein